MAPLGFGIGRPTGKIAMALHWAVTCVGVWFNRPYLPDLAAPVAANSLDHHTGTEHAQTID